MVVGNHHLSYHHYHHHENIQLRSHSNVIGTVVGTHHFEGTLHGRSKYIGGSIVLVKKHSIHLIGMHVFLHFFRRRRRFLLIVTLTVYSFDLLNGDSHGVFHQYKI